MQSQPTAVEVSGSMVKLTFASAPAEEEPMVTLDYTAPASNPVKDAAGNAAPRFSGQPVVRGPVVESIEVSPPVSEMPPAKRYGYTEAQLSSNVLGLGRYKAHAMVAHGAGETLEFYVTFSDPVTVTVHIPTAADKQPQKLPGTFSFSQIIVEICRYDSAAF